MKLVITGISSGIGRETAKALIARGHEVWGIARRQELLLSLSEEVNSKNLHYTVCDINDASGVERWIKEIESENFIPDVVILNAAVQTHNQGVETAHEEVKQVINTNLLSSLRLIEIFKKKMPKAPGGQFILVSSLFALLPDKSDFSYAASKAGISMAFRSMRLEYPGKNILFKILYLGPVETGINASAITTDKKGGLLVASSLDTANYLVNIISSKRHIFYYPFFIRGVYILFSILGDRIYDKLTSRFKRKQ